MGKTAADVLIETLIEWGTDVVFGLPGDGINGIMESLRTHQDQIRFVQVRHEESAAFAAVGYAKFTGRLGVCLATSGPGGLHLTNGLYDAKLDGAPVLAITGHHFSDLIDTASQQDVDLTRVFEDVAVYNTRIMRLGARGERGPPGLPDRAGQATASPTSASPPTSRSSRPTTARARLANSRTMRAWRMRQPANVPADEALDHAAAGAQRGRADGRILAGPRRAGRRRPPGADGRHAGGADRQGAAGQGRRSGRQPVHHGRRSGCWGRSRRRRRWSRATRC